MESTRWRLVVSSNCETHRFEQTDRIVKDWERQYAVTVELPAWVLEVLYQADTGCGCASGFPRCAIFVRVLRRPTFTAKVWDASSRKVQANNTQRRSLLVPPGPGAPR